MRIRDRIRRWLEESPDLLEEAGRIGETRDLPREVMRREQHDSDRILSEGAKSFDRKKFRTVYGILAAIAAAILLGVLLTTVASLPRYGVENERMDEVADYYIEHALEDTGAENIVSGMILDYRAFDTLGESFVLFTALNCVLILLRRDEAGEEAEDDYYDLTHDNILRKAGLLVVPSVILFGFYVMLNGHLSPGGGFSGGAIVGAGLILLAAAFGNAVSARIVTEKTFRILSGAALGFYCLAKSYSFYTGANGIPSIVPLGTPGSIFSAGLILPLDIAVGIVVSLTMYGIYRMFRKGSLK